MAEGTRIQIFGSGAGTTVINTMHLLESVPTQDWQALSIKVDQQWCTHLAGLFQGTTFKWTGCQISWVSPFGPTPQFFAFSRPGGNSGLLPMQVAWVIKLTTGISGRSFNGRWYLSGLSPVVNNLGFPNPTWTDQLVTKLALIKSAWGIAPGQPHTASIYSRKQGVMHPIIFFTPSPVFATIRSRKFGVGI